MKKHEILKHFSQYRDDVKDYFFQELSKFPCGPYKVGTWSRDCDMCESSRVDTVKTYYKLMAHYIDYINSLEWAEGPSSWEILPPETPDSYSQRDRVMEAYENGRGTSIYV